MKKHTLSQLKTHSKEGEQVDSEVFSEQRSNILLVTGNHYNRKHSLFWNRIRESRTLSNEQKLRLTRNHIYRVSKIRKNLILTHCPGVQIVPAMMNDNQSQKSAELNSSVVQFAKTQQSMTAKTAMFASDFFDIGEVVAKIWWNPQKGAFKGFNQKVDEQTGEPMADPETGELVPDEESPIFEGSLEIEREFAFNLIRDASVKRMDDSPWLEIRKMVQVEKLREMVGDDEEKEKMVTEGKDETYIIFDANKQNYQKEKGVTTLRETYFRPCQQYPMGYYYIWVEGGILFEGELPFGIFPIIYEGHDEVPTNARHRSPLKQARPYQIEINRTASAQAEVQVTMGQDKLILQAGAKLTPGEVLPGVRAYHATGRDPTILEGRTGEQWVGSINSNIAELYQVMMIPEEMEQKSTDGDPWMELFKSMKQKKTFSMDCEKFEGFMCRLWETYLDLARHYFPDDILIPAIGKNEIINISEFRNTDKLTYRIKAEPMSDDIHTVMGRTLMINHVLQYAAGSLEKEQIGQLIRQLPFANDEKSFEDFTMGFDRAQNLILALDRGEAPQPNNSDDGVYLNKKLSARMSQPDFQFVHQQIQANYQNMIGLYDELEANKARKIKAMEADFIPTDGPMIKVAWYVKDPTNPARSVQATLPANAIQWLVDRITDQQGFTQPLESLSKGDQANVADIYNNKVAQQQQASAVGMPTSRGMTL